MAKKNFVGPKGARLLRKVAKHILAEPRRYNQNDIISYGKPGSSYGINEKYPKCGTVACIGGWLNILTTTAKPSETDLHAGRLGRLLGIPGNSVFPLISGIGTWGGWPTQFDNAYQIAKSPRQRAEVAAERIEHFIKTGE